MKQIVTRVVLGVGSVGVIIVVLFLIAALHILKFFRTIFLGSPSKGSGKNTATE